MMSQFLNRRGNYKNLLTYQKSQIIYDFTYCFCERFFKRFDRTVDQMVQAARSGKQNIVEGSKAGFTSTETEIKLTNARSSLEELLEDYLDFLRVRQLSVWEKESKQASYVSNLSAGKTNNRNLDRVHQDLSSLFINFANTRSPEICANIMICLIQQCNFLLGRQLSSLEKDFLENGGMREEMYKARKSS